MLTDNICLLQQGELNIYYFSRVITFILPMLIKYFALTCQPGLWRHIDNVGISNLLYPVVINMFCSISSRYGPC